MIWDSGETKSIYMVHIGDYVSNDMDGNDSRIGYAK